MAAIVPPLLAATLALGGCTAGPGTPATGPGSSTGTESVAATQPASVPPAETPPAMAEIEAAITRLAEANSAGVKVASVTNLKAARDSTGVWWAAGTAVPVDPKSVESARVVIRQEGGEWVLVVIGTALSPEDLPAEMSGIL
jgi:hypothetical protein